jgi:glycosyltransferase involved in cell wall biosynthesis
LSAQQKPRRLLFVVNAPWFFLSHRLPIALAARDAGYDVHVATMDDAGVEQIKAHGFAHHALPMTRSGLNPAAELRTLLAMRALFRGLKPDIVHLVTIKAVIHGGIAARMARVPAVVAAISGLGFVFLARGFKASVVRAVAVRCYRAALDHPRMRVIFQNESDRDTLVALRVVRPDQAIVLRGGSGVDLAGFPAFPEPATTPIVVMAARLLADKGVREFVAAARLLHERSVPARFQLAGDVDPGNAATIDAKELAGWRATGIVEVLGQRTDIPAIFGAAHVVVLPSYREGLPKVLIEAAACGRAVVTTDVPGCRDAIEPGRTGLLVPVRDAVALADAIERLVVNPEIRATMGRMGRALAEREFDVRRVVESHMAVYAGLGA